MTPTLRDGMTNRAERPEKRSRRFIRRVSSLIGLAILFAIAALSIGFLMFVDKLVPSSSPIVDGGSRLDRDPADGIVVLTGGAERITDAVRLLADGAGKRLLISGINERTSRLEVARANPELGRLAACCIDFGWSARNTIGNAREARAWAQERGFRSLIVVTSNYHMARTLAEFRHAMPQARLQPFAVVTDQTEPGHWWTHPPTVRLLVSEYLKYLVTCLRIEMEQAGGPRLVAGPGIGGADEGVAGLVG